ncbi:MAG: twin-arginine translocase subunit TatC [Deltaproteobacteria bacterium]|nr:MAG: twin-arginine translocase subunit TatC [Deltaproteobacteria bacterium]
MTGEPTDQELQDLDEIGAVRMPLLEHLRELRNRVVKALIAVGAGLIVGMIFAKDVIDLAVAPVRKILPGTGEPTRMDLIYHDLTQPFTMLPGWNWLNQAQARGDLTIIGSLEGVWTWLRAAFVLGGLIALPFVAWQIWQFIAPGLYKTERRIVLPLTVASTALFLIGSAFAYFFIVPMAFGFFLTFLDLETTLSIEDAVRTVLRITVAFGLCYQLPVVVWFLARIGLVDHRDMVRYFRYAIVGIFIVAAVVTPPDIITQFFLGVPLILLYGASIGVAWLSTTKVREPEELALYDGTR